MRLASLQPFGQIGEVGLLCERAVRFELYPGFLGHQIHTHEKGVEAVLDEIGALEIPRMTVFNKIDLTAVGPDVINAGSGLPAKLWLSAATGAGTELFQQALLQYLGGDRKVRRLRLTAGSGKFRARVYEWAEVRQEWLDGEGNWLLDVLVDDATAGRLDSLRQSEKDLVWMDQADKLCT